MAMRDIGSHARRSPKAPAHKTCGSRRSGRAGEPAAGESVGASESLDDVPYCPRLPSYPVDRLTDLFGSLSTLFGINPRKCKIPAFRYPHLEFFNTFGQMARSRIMRIRLRLLGDVVPDRSPTDIGDFIQGNRLATQFHHNAKSVRIVDVFRL